jgi:cytochrome c oxidase subunit 2
LKRGEFERMRVLLAVFYVVATRSCRAAAKRIGAKLALRRRAAWPVAWLAASRRAWRAVSTSALAVTVAANRADAAPLDYFLHAAGPAAIPTQRLGWALTALCAGVTLLVAALLAFALLHRRAAAQPGSLVSGRGGLRWVYAGTGISCVLLLGALIYTLFTLYTVAAPRREPALTITVTAYDWWWRIDYADSPDPARNFATANEIHIPTGAPVRVQLKSADVIHAFWVPQLAGKTQTIPGQTNEQWIEADQPGIYRGQCSQFCGAQHAHMAFEVIAQRPTDFDAWRAAQAQAAAAPAPHEAAALAAGRKLFGERCAGCHTVRGTAAAGSHAPDLTHLDSRRLIAAGTLANTPENQLDWIRHAQRIKPDSLMPGIVLSAAEAAELSAYLATLH